MENTPSDTQSSGTSSGRLTSIDALRGFDMFWIIGGGEILSELAKARQNQFTLSLQAQLEHVSWEGCHFEDLIYPLFLFIIGIVLPFSLARRREQGQSLGSLYLHCLTRALVLVLLGSILATMEIEGTGR